MHAAGPCLLACASSHVLDGPWLCCQQTTPGVVLIILSPCQLAACPMPPATWLLHHTGRLIDEQEKQRCALLMQFKGSIPNASQLTPTGQARIAALRARSSTSGGSSSAMPQADAVPVVLAAQRAALQGRFQEVEHEIAEREEFVATMQRLGKLQPEQMHAMRAEAAGKVQEMRQLDAEIKDLDAELRADYDRLAGTAS